ncbi:phage portal protein, partial [Nonomuraea recticatena]
VDPPTAGATLLMPDEVAHFSPHPDPEARFRGMSPITPVVREIQADTQSTIHKQAFLKNAATPNLVVKFDRETSEDAFDEFVKQFRSSHQGSRNAYKTLFLTGGADVEAVGVDFKQLDFAATVGKGESRLASAFGVPPSWVGFSEALAGSSLNAGNFTAARDRFADGTVRPWWRDAAASLEVLIERPDDGASLWYDDRDIAFLRKDEAEQAKIHAAEAQTIRTLIDAGMTATSVVDAVNAQDWSLLEHSGLYSVQLQPANQQPTQPATGNSPEESGEETED